MNALLLVAHGSRRKESNDEVFALSDKLKNAKSITSEIVHTAFLDIASPSISEGITKCIEDGATAITLIPYFLNSGRHVITDIPSIVEQSKTQYPEITIEIAPHLGKSALMTELLIKLVNSKGE